MARLLDRRRFKGIDWWLFATIVALACFGFVSITAAMATAYTGNEVTMAEKLANLNLALVKRQMTWFFVGLVAMVAIMMIDYRNLMDIAGWVYWVNIVVLALLYFLATVTKNTVSWYTFGGIGFQPSELMKISLMLMLGQLFARRSSDARLEHLSDVWQPAAYTILPFMLVALQPDFGTAAVLACIGVGICLVVGVSKRLFFGTVGALGVSLPLIWLVLSDMQKNRLLAFFDPKYDLGNAGYHVLRSKIAIGSGQLMGKGVFAEGNLSQLSWIPVKESDFIFSVTSEIFGFVGGSILLLLFGFLLYRTLRIAMRTRDRFGQIVVVGVATMIFVHMFENVGMAMGLMPVTGIPLPFISYGGSNMLTNMIAYGLVLNIGSRT